MRDWARACATIATVSLFAHLTLTFTGHHDPIVAALATTSVLTWTLLILVYLAPTGWAFLRWLIAGSLVRTPPARARHARDTVPPVTRWAVRTCARAIVRVLPGAPTRTRTRSRTRTRTRGRGARR